MDSPLPSRIDRTTLDRVLKRASELQGSAHDVGESLTEDETVALGKEVGLPVELIKQALIEERVRVSVETTTGGLFRPVDVMAQRVIQGDPDRIMSALSEWLEAHESFVVQRRQESVSTFEPMEQFTRAMRRIGRMFRGGGRPYLERAALVKCVVTPLEPGYQHLAIVASVGPPREMVIALAVNTIVILAAVGLLAALGAIAVIPAIVVGVALAGGIIAIATRIYRGVAARRNARVRLGLERALDDLQQNPTLASTAALPRSSDIARNLGRVVRDISVEVRKALDR